MAHAYAPAEDAPVLIEVKLWPAGGVARLFEAIYRLTRTRRLAPPEDRGRARHPALCLAHRFYLAAAPLAMQRPLVAAVAAVAALVRIDPWSYAFAAQPPSDSPFAVGDVWPAPVT